MLKQVVKNRKWYLIFLTGIVFSSCYQGNTDSIEKGKLIYRNYKNQLVKVKPILDNAIDDSCQVFSIEMSPTTSFFNFYGEIDRLYDSTKFRQFDKKEELLIQQLRPRLEISSIMYLKGVFIAFQIHRINHLSMLNCYLVHVVNKDKFARCLPNLKKYDKKYQDSQPDWKYYIDKEWAVCCGSLIHNGDETICEILCSNN